MLLLHPFCLTRTLSLRIPVIKPQTMLRKNICCGLHNHLRNLTHCSARVLNKSSIQFKSIGQTHLGRFRSVENIAIDASGVKFYSVAKQSSQFSYVYNSKRVPVEKPLVVKQTLLETCKDLFEDYPHGQMFETTYLDTAGSEDRPTVCMIHGAPGSHQDFLPIANILVKNGVRVIAPNTPGFGFTKGCSSTDDSNFCQSAEERADFLIDFLIATKTNRLDMILAHGTAASPALKMVSISSKAKSLALISPITDDQTMFDDPHFVDRLSPKIDAFLWKRTVRKYLTSRSLQWGISAEDPHHMMQAALATCKTQFNDMTSFAISVGYKNIPTLAFYTRDDRFIPPHVTEPFLYHLGIHKDQTAVIEIDGSFSEKGDKFDSGCQRAMVFREGCHHPHLKHPETVAYEILKLLDQVSKQGQS